MTHTAAGSFLGTRFEDALIYALDLHRHDTRKGKPTPYVSHLLGVCSLVLQDGGDEDEAIAALLHDALEDHAERVVPADLGRRFGSRVLEIVRSCSDTPPDYAGGTKPPWKERKLRYIAHLAQTTPSARRVSLADKLYNLREVVSDLRIEGQQTWARFNAGAAEQCWYYRSIAEMMRQAGQCGPMLDAYEREFGELEKLMAKQDRG